MLESAHPWRLRDSESDQLTKVPDDRTVTGKEAIMKVRIVATMALICVFVLPAAALAQDYGDGFGVGGVFLPSGNNVIMAKMRLGDAMALEVSAGLSTFSDDGYSSTDLSLGAGVLFHANPDEKLQPYWGGRLSIWHMSEDYDDDAMGNGGDWDETKFGVTGVVGAEYFINRRLSLEGEIGLGMHFGSFSLTSGSRLAALLYL